MVSTTCLSVNFKCETRNFEKTNLTSNFEFQRCGFSEYLSEETNIKATLCSFAIGNIYFPSIKS